MKFLHYIVTIGSGDAVRVHLTGNAANVLVMDDSNFRLYNEGKEYRYYGGYYTRTPAIIRPPSPGRWNVVVNLGGGVGSVNAIVHVVRS
jgi:hypothetical protein